MPIRDLLLRSRRILVMKLRYVGDSLWMIPFLENLKRNLPDAEITVLVNEGSEVFFLGNRAVDRVEGFPIREVKSGWKGIPAFFSSVGKIRKARPDVAIDLTDADRPALIAFLSGAGVRVSYTHRVGWRNWFFTHVVRPRQVKHMVPYHLDFLREMGLDVHGDAIRVRVPDSAVEALRAKVPSVFVDDGRKRILVHPGARVPLRQWGAGQFAGLCDLLGKRHRVFLATGPDEEELLREVRDLMTGKPEICSSGFSLGEFAALCGQSDLFVGNDSGPIHIAAATGTFVVGIYGPNLGESAGPWGDRRYLFEVEGLRCRPCRQDRCVHEEFKACLCRIDPADVAGKIEEILAGTHADASMDMR